MMSIRVVFSSFAALLWLLTPALATAQLVIGTGAGTSPLVRHIDATGAERLFFAYDPAFVGGVHVALGRTSTATGSSTSSPARTRASLHSSASSTAWT